MLCVVSSKWCVWTARLIAAAEEEETQSWNRWNCLSIVFVCMLGQDVCLSKDLYQSRFLDIEYRSIGPQTCLLHSGKVLHITHIYNLYFAKRTSQHLGTWPERKCIGKIHHLLLLLAKH